MNTRIVVSAAVALVATACSFNFDRGSDLGPGDVAGTVTLANGDVGRFARVVVDGTGRILRADREGRFVVKGLAVGTWALRVDFDRDGDGWPEELARRAVQIRADNGAASFVDLGPVQLAGPAALRGVVEPPAGVEVTGASVAIVRTVELESDGAAFTADQGVEARVGAGEDGAFFFPAIEEGAGKIRVLLEIDDELYASEDVAVDVGPGENNLAEPIPLTLQPVDLSRLASLFVAPRGGADERFVVDLLAAGKAPSEAPDFDGPRVLEPTNLTLDDVPLGVFDVHVRSNQGRAGVLHERQVPPAASTEVIEWGLVHLEIVLCPNDDCDEDGVAGLPPRDGDDDPLWAECLEQCQAGADFDIENVAEGRCVVDGVTYDCEDDGDGQPDPTEPRCYGVGFGADNDGDGICNPVDAFPFCFANDASCDPEDVTGQYGGDGEPTPPGPDAGPDPVDAGTPIDDAGTPVDDAGPQQLPPRGAFVTAGFEPSFERPSVLVESILDRTAFVFGAFGEVQGPATSNCAIERAQPSGLRYYVARYDADGACREIAFGGDDGFGESAVAARAGEDIVVASVTEQASFSPGVDSAGNPVNETTGGQRIVVARIGPDLVVKDVGVIPIQDDGVQGGVTVTPRGIAPLGVDELVLVIDTFDAAVTYAPGAPAALSIAASGGAQATLLRLDAALAFAGGLDSASDGDAFPGQLISDGASGVALTVVPTAATTIFGADVTGAPELIFAFDAQLAVRFVAFGVGDDTLTLGAHAGDLHAAVSTGADPTGVYLFGPTAQANRAAVQKVAAPDAPPEFGGAIFDLDNLSRWTFDPVRRAFIVGGVTGLVATPANPGFGFVPEPIGSPTGILHIELDAVNRQLFYTDGSGQMHSCDVEACDATDAVIASNIFGPFAVDPVAQKIYFPGQGIDRMDYSGANPENFFDAVIVAAIDIDSNTGEVFWFDAELFGFFRGNVSTAFSEVDLQVSGPGTPRDLAVDPRDGRVYNIVGAELFSFLRDGADPQTATISTLVPLEGLVFADFPPQAIRVGGASAPVARSGITLVRFAGDGTPTSEVLAASEGAFAEQLRVIDGAAYLLGGLEAGRVTLEGSTLEVRADNEAGAAAELFVTRIADDGQSYTPEWVSQTRAPGFVRFGSLDVTADGDVLISGGVQGGTVGELLAPTGTDFYWHLPPEGELVPPLLRTPLGAADAATLLGALSSAPVSLPHGNGGWLGAAPDGNGGFFLERADAIGSTWRRDVTNGLPFNIDVSPNGNVGVVIGFSGTFTLDALSHSVVGDDVGVAALVFDADGQLAASAFAALSTGSDAADIGVRDDGSFALLLNAAAAFSLEDEQAAPVTGTTTGAQAILAAYGADGRLIAHHVGDASPESIGEALSVAQDGTAVALVTGAVAGVTGGSTLLHVDELGVNDWNVGIEVNGASNVLSAVDTAHSLDGNVAAVALTFDAGVSDVVFRNSCFDVTFTSNNSETTLVHTFDRDGCPVDFASLESFSPMADTRVQFVDAGGDFVVAGGFSSDVFLDAANGQVTATTNGASIYAAFLSANIFSLDARTLRVVEGAVSPQLEGFGAYHRGQTWIRGFVGAAGSAVFSEDRGASVNYGGDGFIWNLEPANDLNDAFFQGG